MASHPDSYLRAYLWQERAGLISQGQSCGNHLPVGAYRAQQSRLFIDQKAEGCCRLSTDRYASVSGKTVAMPRSVKSWFKFRELGA